MTEADRIRELLSRKPGLKTLQIAAELGLERSQAAAALKSLLGNDLTQDNSYCWWLKAAMPAPIENSPGPRTFLNRLCRYYLECLAQESGSAISLPAEPGLSYVPLAEMPFVRRAGVPLADERALKKLVQKARRERGQLALYLGYAVRLRILNNGKGEESRLEPVLLYPIEETNEFSADFLRPASAIPLFNMEVLKSMAAVDSGNILDEAVHLSEDLGLASAGPDDELPLWDEIAYRLQHCRPDWDWREDLDPYALTQTPALHELRQPGIYNRAILFAATRSPFTYGLENELRKLAALDEKAVEGTVLGRLLRGEGVDEPPAEDRPILELLPLNTEQRQAVLQGLSAPLTVVTGPPGTGKSQVVISLLANVAWQGGTALFASKNNHAVDVVETRANELGTHPLLLRLGREEHQARLSQHLTAGLAESSRPGDAEAYEWLARAHEQGCENFRAVQQEIAGVVALRNRVDELERAAEPARALFGRSQFKELRSFDSEGLEQRLGALATAILAARSFHEQGVVRLLRDSVETAQEALRGTKRKVEPGEASPNRRLRRVDEAAREMQPLCAELKLALPVDVPEEDFLDAWEEFLRACRERLDWVVRAQDYWRAFDQLRVAGRLEQLAGELSRLAAESSANSLELWQRWLRLWPSRWGPEQRRLLSEYISLVQMIASGEHFDEGAGKKVFHRYYTLFPKVLKMLPCWGVTTLSARGRLPFEPACFDLVVIDEASQCDIASALPLLLRAKRAVIIGDPFQLKHVSTVAPRHDRMILAAHGLAEGSAAWAYSVNSLFDLARGLCRHEDIVNLRDHHRSHRDIITFSNRHFYRGGLRVATDHKLLRRPRQTGPAVRWVDVKGKVMRPSRGGAVNPVEAEALLAELRRLVLDEGYDGAIGVVTPFRAHANRIRTLAFQDPGLSGRLAAMQFTVDTVHGFQGDERDVIFFSPVLSLGVSDGTLRFLNNHGNLFNVAITRARSELVVVGDRQAALNSGVKYLASFAEYSQALAAEDSGSAAIQDLGPDYPVVPRPELVSDWERIFYKAMFAAGLRPVPQYVESPFTLDFALFQGERKLDIEVDGEAYHRNWDGELCRRDQIRSRRLNDQGWDVMRFWVYEVRDDLEGSLARVRAWFGS
jgi:very-short-patch-repair endonuclease/KaiC/GvpD/RAD55 family RecA-like ATPase